MKEEFEVRRPMVAGMFYPANPIELAKQLAGFFNQAGKRHFDGQIKAIIAPHAGYQYSGQIAADAYKQIEGEEYETVVVIAPFHGFFKGVSVYSGGGYQTPLGVIEIDRKMSSEMSLKHPDVYASTAGHSGTSGRGEHSLEVQLPFLQTVLGRFKLVAMIMGDQEESTVRTLAEVMAAVLADKNALIVASTDLSHFHPEKEARRLDKNFEKALQSLDTSKIIETVTRGLAEACGFGPVAAVVETMRRVGGRKVEIIRYGTSGETTGDFSDVVGYLSAVVVGERAEIKKPATIGSPMKARSNGHAEEEKDYLKMIARRAVEARAVGRKYERPPLPSNRLEEKRGVFVTITRHGQLRGCIGLIQAREPLVEAVEEMALAAAFEDPRFEPVSQSELKELDYEISVMSPLSLVDNIDNIAVGRDGLMIRLDMHSGLLLPQVATEQGWDRLTFLEQTCLKAGLPKSSYKDKRAQIYKFTVEKF